MNKRDLRIVFFGTPDFAAVVLEALIENDFNIVAVFTQPDKKVGRRRKIVFSPVKKLALEKKISVFQPENLQDIGIIGEIRETGAGLIIVAAYGKILPKEVLEISQYGAINVHASLLPKYRGASPVQSAILAGEKETGITLMLMNEKMDEGDIVAQEKIKIGENETAESLLGKLGKLGAKMIIEFIPEWIAGKIKPQRQDGKKATYCKLVKREDGKIDWGNETAGEIYRKWRAFQPWPGIFALYCKKGRSSRLKLVDVSLGLEVGAGKKPGGIVKYNKDAAVETKKGLIVLRKVQPEGKKIMNAGDFLRGNPNFSNG